MATSNKDQLDRWVSQTINALDRACENMGKCVDRYEGKAPQQFEDCMQMLILISDVKETVEEFYKSRM